MTAESWHQLCTLREDVRTSSLTLVKFAADLNSVHTGEAPAVYHEPGQFFSRTHPTYCVKLLAREIVQRMAGRVADLHCSFRWPTVGAERTH